jgi:hypothetical protein
MNDTEQDVVVPLNSVDVEIRASRKKLDQDFKEFWEGEDAKSTGAPDPVARPEAEATLLSAEIIAERDRLRAENERLKVIEREVDIASDPDFQKTYVKPLSDTYASCLQELGQYFDAPADKVQKESVAADTLFRGAGHDLFDARQVRRQFPTARMLPGLFEG